MEGTPGTSNVEDEMFVIEGKLSDVHVELGTENLLARVDQHYKGKAAAAGVGAVVGDLFGQAASAASLAMYDGEDTQNFMCLIDGQVMCGQFGGAEWLRADHRVRAVVSRRGDVLYAQGILDAATGLLWVGFSKGSKAEAQANWNIAWWCYGFGMLGVILASTFQGTGGWSFGETLLYGAVSLAVICFGVALWANRDMQVLAGPSTEVYRLLGFANPAAVDMSSYRISLEGDNDYLDRQGLREPTNMVNAMCQVRNVYLYKRAIEDGKLAMSVEAPSDAKSQESP